MTNRDKLYKLLSEKFANDSIGLLTTANKHLHEECIMDILLGRDKSDNYCPRQINCKECITNWLKEDDEGVMLNG